MALASAELAKHRSGSEARSSPTRRETPKKIVGNVNNDEIFLLFFR
ncbi:MAG TPA: hypothetical protein PKH93_13070 [Chitinophagales bacterium]|nr:hypothetical protein [Chitinophagales bacterium]